MQQRQASSEVSDRRSGWKQHWRGRQGSDDVRLRRSQKDFRPYFKREGNIGEGNDLIRLAGGGWAVRKARVKAEELLEVCNCRPERNA